MVTDTITKSAEKLLPLGIVFMSVLLMYCSLGTLLFGEELESFRNMSQAFQQCMLILLGDWVSELRAHSLVFASIHC